MNHDFDLDQYLKSYDIITYKANRLKKVREELTDFIENVLIED